MNTNESESKIITCEECGCVIESEDDVVVLPNGKTVCRDCADRLGYVQCDDCGEWVSRDDTIVYDDMILCEDCRDNRNLVQCDECGEWFDESDLTEIDMGWRRSNICICEDCRDTAENRGDIFFCCDCGEWYHTDQTGYYALPDGDTICSHCYENHDYCTCADCGDVIHTWNAHCDDYSEEWYCDDCWSSRERDSHKIHDYGYRPSPIFHGIERYSWEDPKPSDPITIGFELEVDKGDDRNDCAEDLCDAFSDDDIYLKSDSSVDFEIVTHPRTLKSYMEDFDFEKLCSIPPKHGYSSHNAGTCGLHCHVGRTQLGRTDGERKNTIAKIALLMYRHWNQLVKFSRRSEGQLSRWAAAPSFEFSGRRLDEDELRDVVYSYYRYRGRYQALNLEPRNTIEFRLWRGTLQADTLKATIQLTSNIVEYCKAHSYEDVVTSDWSDVCHHESFPELDAYLEKRGLVSYGNPRTIPFGTTPTSTTPTSTNTNSDTGFNVGDLVEITNSNGELVGSWTVGARGRIIYIEDTPGNCYDGQILIRFDHSDCFSHNTARRYGHQGDGRTPEGDGYWVYPENINRLAG